MESERALQGYLFRRAKQHGIYCRKMRAEGQTGFPDVLLAHDGIVMFVELKSPTGKGRLVRASEARAAAPARRGHARRRGL